ncbi:MAG: Mrp/NBP35 family ATP-binding protein [Fibrobacteraceae bacterium]|nr:Mrp/NBP35 family ATP-binding protein [Fibrobacteraceae bacterium]
MINEQQILNALSVVRDPDLQKNIVELGFVQNIQISGKGDVIFDLVLTTPACPVRDRFKDQCEQILRDIGAITATVNLKASNGRVASASKAAPMDNALLKDVHRIIGVASGKGGVGKSTVTANLAMALSLAGARVGVLDADIYGPSMNIMFGVDSAPEVHDDRTISPVITKGGIELISMAMFADSDKATIWRGPMASQMIQNFIHRVRWGVLDYLLVDFPPGTGDIQLTLTQNCPMTCAVVVTTPQEVALADCRKGLAMFDSVGVPVVGIVENMSYFVCDGCGKRHDIFRTGGGERIAKALGVPLLGKVPLEPGVADCGDLGSPVVLRYPNSTSGRTFAEIAERTIRSIALLEDSESKVLHNFNLRWNEIPLEGKA